MTTQELKNALIEKNHEADKVERVTDKIENLSPDIMRPWKTGQRPMFLKARYTAATMSRPSARPSLP